MNLNDTFIVFDLDDTLFRERDFLLSGYRAITGRLADENGCDAETLYRGMTKAVNPLDWLYEAIGGIHDIPWMLEIYRNHYPDLALDDDTVETLARLKGHGCRIGILTEGREITQLNKIKALGLDRFVTVPPMIVTPRERGGKGKDFLRFVEQNGVSVSRMVSVGDNPVKDFAQPNGMGWLTIAIADKGENIHPQRFAECTLQNMPHYIIDDFRMLLPLLA